MMLIKCKKGTNLFIFFHIEKQLNMYTKIMVLYSKISVISFLGNAKQQQKQIRNLVMINTTQGKSPTKKKLRGNYRHLTHLF